MVATILLVSADATLVETITQAVGSAPHLAKNLADALPQLDSTSLKVVFYHIVGDKDAKSVKQLLDQFPRQSVRVVAISDEYDPLQACELLRAGATDYLHRPLDIRRLELLIDVLTYRLRNARKKEATARVSPTDAVGDFLCDPTTMKQLMEQVHAVAPLDTTILLTGETGTGKTRLARLIHEKSARCEKQFLSINCGALSPTLMESEMFGHVKGAFTGADYDREGKFAAAGDGTLVLDEIDALSLETQAKLLKAVDERVFECVGDNHPLRLRARLVIATNRDLEEEVAAGRFRTDLFYRVNVVTLHLPPLRERVSQIALLANHYLSKFAEHSGRTPLAIAEEAFHALRTYAWPGNIRELKNVIERAAALCRSSRIELSNLPESIRGEPGPKARPSKAKPTLGKWLKTKIDAEVNAILSALAQHDNNRMRAAQELGISRVTLYKKMRKYRLLS